jgi:SAM-dependent methyltransferase
VSDSHEEIDPIDDPPLHEAGTPTAADTPSAPDPGPVVLRPKEPPADTRSETKHIDYTNSQHRWRGLITRFNIAGRRKFYRAFMDVMAPTSETTILDVGVTPDQTTEDSNFFEKWFPHPEQITATSIEDASYLESAHPGLTFVPISGDRLPFEDRQFDIAFCTAVIEHTGDRERQRQFVAELLRVSDRFFLTTPNRRFPVELHTYVPFIHWLPQHLHQQALRRLRKEDWAKTENLNLLDQADLTALFPEDVHPTVSGIRLFGMRSNIIAFGPSHP